jgi:hypothetical protein
MSNNYMKNLAAAFLRAKLAAQTPEEAMHEQAETPEQEQLEHAPGGYEEGGELPGDEGHEQMEAPEAEGLEHATGGLEEGDEEMGGLNPDEDAHLDQMLSQLSPEELDQLAEQLAGEMQGGPAAGPEGGGEDVGELAQAIEQHLSQNPEASIPQAAPEKMAALEFVKSASYIEGFLNQAIDRGVSVKQAIDMYDQSLTNTIISLKHAELKGNQHKLDVDCDGKIEAEDLKKLREGNKGKTAELKGNQHKLDADHDGKIEAEDLKKLREDAKGKTAEELREEIKTAAYYEGVIERAREHGLSDYDAVNFVKEAVARKRNPGQRKPFKSKRAKVSENPGSTFKNFVKGFGTGAVGGAAAGATLGVAGGKKLTEKEAAAKRSRKSPPRSKSSDSPFYKSKAFYSGTAAGAIPAAGAGVLTGGVVGAGAGLLSRKDKKDKEKSAAYEQGLLERAAEYGFSPEQTAAILKQANLARYGANALKGSKFAPKASTPPKARFSQKANVPSKPKQKQKPKQKSRTSYEQAKEDASGIKNTVSSYIKKNPLKSTAGALGAGAVGGYLAGDEK